MFSSCVQIFYALGRAMVVTMSSTCVKVYMSGIATLILLSWNCVGVSEWDGTIATMSSSCAKVKISLRFEIWELC
jgi:hypothetical protein